MQQQLLNIKKIKVKSALNICFFTMLLFIIQGCEDFFEYSPYAANVKSEFKNSFDTNLNKILSTDTIPKSEFKFAVIADSHYNYHELNEAVINLNSRNDIDFVIVNGDIADHGYNKEYELFLKNIKKLRVPFLTVIGNHDYRSNGDKIYQEMFGEPNRTFIYNNQKFILFDDIFWESNKTPDFNWLENELYTASKYERVYVFCHIPPYGDEFTDEYENLYKQLMINYNVDMSIHGHIHRFEYGDYYHDGMIYLAVESIMDKEYGLVTVTDAGITVESIKY